jgi:uncharacterized DUF497 family protein
LISAIADQATSRTFSRCFSYPHAKACANTARHGVDFPTAQEAFADPQALVLFDAAHSDGRELRGWLLGRIGARILLVRYAHRPDGVIRLIGAGCWREGRDYDENHWKKTET